MFVSRRLYDALQARYDEAMTWNRALVQQIVELRREGFAAPRTATERAPQAPPPLDIEDMAREGANREAIERMTADFVRNGADPDVAEREAKKLIGEMHAVYDLD